MYTCFVIFMHTRKTKHHCRDDGEDEDEEPEPVGEDEEPEPMGENEEPEPVAKRRRME